MVRGEEGGDVRRRKEGGGEGRRAGTSFVINIILLPSIIFVKDVRILYRNTWKT